MTAPSRPGQPDDPAGSKRRRDRAVASRRYQACWVAVVVCLVGVLSGCTKAATPSDAAGPSATAPLSGTPTADDGARAAPVRVLQLNLCNSGIAALLYRSVHQRRQPR